MEGVTEGIIRRASALKTAGGGVGLTASYRLPFQPEPIVNDSSSGTEGTRAVVLAGDQARLNGGNLVASGGWCAPSETVYELTGMSCPEMLWDLPEIQLARGGLRYFPMPSLDVAAMTFVHTEADDISGAVKPCFRIPCPEPVEVRCEAIGACLESGILTQRHFPELVAYYQSLVMVAHEIRMRQKLFTQAVAASTAVTIAPTFGAFSALFAAVALQAADMTEKLSLCQNINIEVVFPWWSKNLFLADVARQNAVSVAGINIADVVAAFAQLGISIQWARGLTPAVPTEIGGPTPATDWPASVPFLIYPAGTFEAGRGGEISLGVIHDSTKFQTNDFTALFTEECSALIARNNEARVVTVPVCRCRTASSEAAPTSSTSRTCTSSSAWNGCRSGAAPCVTPTGAPRSPREPHRPRRISALPRRSSPSRTRSTPVRSARRWAGVTRRPSSRSRPPSNSASSVRSKRLSGETTSPCACTRIEVSTVSRPSCCSAQACRSSSMSSSVS